VFLVRRLAYLVPRFRAGLVTYDDQARRRCELTADERVLDEAFGKVVAAGGGDYEEGVDRGIGLALRQEQMGWSARAHRVIVVVGDAPPHGADVPALLRRVRDARHDEMYDHPVVVCTVSTEPGGVDGFPEIAAAGGGVHVTLADVGRLEEEVVALAFGAAFRERVKPWLEEVESVRRGDRGRDAETGGDRGRRR
jgi:hypothetical protein